MESFIFNNNKSNKKQTMFANIAALSIIVLQLLGQLNITGANSVGYWNHSLQEGKVTLAKGSRVAVAREDFVQYMWSSPEACNIDTLNMKENKYITLSYYKGKDKGCTVDLLTDKKDEIVFSAVLKHYSGDGIGGCLNKDDTNSNVLPFAYSLTNEEVKKFHNGPLFANGACPDCEEGCVKKTGLELRWTYLKGPSGREWPLLVTNPIATKFVNFTAGKLFMENILSPSTWEIVGTRPDPIMTRLLVFHLLPQTASRKMTTKVEDLVTGKKYVVENEHPNGPKCDFLEISFDKRNYRLLTVSPITSTSKKPTLPTQGLPIIQQKTAPSSKSATKSPSKTTITKAKTIRTSTTKDSSGSLLLVVIIVVVVIILVVIVIGIAVYFVSRKDSGKKEKGAVRPNK
uniref:Uncharacterized protein n=1 Tax=Meloidogyne incognita TaxID=6306 RepID=A0A914LMJ2_MELIC